MEEKRKIGRKNNYNIFIYAYIYIIIKTKNILDFDLSDVLNAKPTEGCRNMQSWEHYSNAKKVPSPSQQTVLPYKSALSATLNQQTPVGTTI